MLCQGTGEHNCATPNKYLSIFTQDNTITIPTVEQEPKTMNKTQLQAQRLMSIYNNNNNKKSIQQERITSTERHYTAPAEDANSSYDKVITSIFCFLYRVSYGASLEGL